MRIVQLSDFHLSSKLPYTLTHLQLALEMVADDSPDLVVISGDITCFGNQGVDDYELARLHLADLSLPWLAIPGNHDVGAHPFAQTEQEFSLEALARFHQYIGPDRWTHDGGEIKLIGINSELCGTDTAEEQEQLTWLQDELTSAPVVDSAESPAESPEPGRRAGGVVVFMHSMCYISDVNEESSGFTLDPEPRKRLLGIFHDAPVRTVFNGHLHQDFAITHKGLPLVSCPSIAFPTPCDCFPPEADNRPGYFLIHATADGVSYEKKLLPAERLSPDMRLYHL